MPKEHNQALPYLGKVHEICQGLPRNLEHYLYEYDDGEKRGKREGKEIALDVLNEQITQLQQLRKAFITGDPLTDD